MIQYLLCYCLHITGTKSSVSKLYSTVKSFLYVAIVSSFNDLFPTVMFHRFCMSSRIVTTSIAVFGVVIYATTGSCLITMNLLFLRILNCNIQKFSTNVTQSRMEFHVQKILIKNINMSLVVVSFAFIGKIIYRRVFRKRQY